MSCSAAWGDLDGDGKPDLPIASGYSMGRSIGLPSDGSYRLLHNVANNSHHWLMIDPQGTRSNRDGNGAEVHVSAARQVLRISEPPTP